MPETNQPITETPKPEATANATEQIKAEGQPGGVDAGIAVDKPNDKPDGKPAPEKPQTHKIKVYGEEREVSTEELIVLAQKAAGADDKFQSTEKERAKLVELFNALKGSPFQVLEKLGLDPRKLSEEYLYGVYQYEKMPEAERKAMEAQKKAEELAKQNEEYKQKLSAAEMAQAQARYEAEYTDKLIGAIDKAGLPKNEDTVSYIVTRMLADVSKGNEPDADKAASELKNFFKAHGKDYITTAKEDELREILGDDGVKKIAGLTLKKSDGNRVDPEAPQKVDESKRKSKKQTWAEFEKELNERLA